MQKKTKIYLLIASFYLLESHSFAACGMKEISCYRYEGPNSPKANFIGYLYGGKKVQYVAEGLKCFPPPPWSTTFMREECLKTYPNECKPNQGVFKKSYCIAPTFGNNSWQ